MKNAFSLILFSLLFCAAHAQTPPPQLISKDTINVYGYIYDVNNRPLRATIISRSSRLLLEQTKTSTVTDSNGLFHLKGISPLDTLNISTGQSSIDIINYGSRFIKIKIPNRKSPFINKGIPIVAKRIVKKEVKAFKVTEPAENLLFAHHNYNDAEFPGGLKKFFNLISPQLSYTKKALDNNIEGVVEVSFEINKDGTVLNVNLVRGLGYGLDEQVIIAVQKSPKWKPEIFAGAPLISEKHVSFDFKLTDR